MKEGVATKTTFSSAQIVDYFKNRFFSSRQFKCTEDQMTGVLSLIPEGLQFSLVGAKELKDLPIQCPSCAGPTSLKDTNAQKLLDINEAEKESLVKSIVQVLTPTKCEYCSTALGHLEIVGKNTTEATIQSPFVSSPEMMLSTEEYQFPTFGKNTVSVGSSNQQDRIVGRSGTIGEYGKIGFVGMSTNLDISASTKIHHLVSPRIIIKEPYELGLVITSSFNAKANPYYDKRSIIDILLIAPGNDDCRIQNCDIGVLLVADHEGSITFGYGTNVTKAFYSANIEPNTGNHVSMPQEELIDANEMAHLFNTGVMQGNIPLFLERLKQFAKYQASVRNIR